jgi:hypothetical protein
MLQKIKNYFKTRQKERADKAEQQLVLDYINSKINHRANTLHEKYSKFKHVIFVDYNKVFDSDGFFDVYCDDIKQYFYPFKTIEESTQVFYERVVPSYTIDNKREYILNGIGTTDILICATDNDIDAMMITLKYV